MRPREPTALGLADLGSGALILFSLTATALVLAGIFSALRAVVLSGLLASCAWSWLHIRLQPGRVAQGAGFMLVLLLALLFRLGPADYVLGGQDQGIYTFLARSLERNGGTACRDRVREAILDEDLRALYDRDNQYELDRVRVPGWYEGHHDMGVYVQDLVHSRYVFQFYPLVPAWMATFERGLGQGRGAWALVAFGLLSLSGLMLLARELTGSRAAALLLGGALATNPLHAYFSRFPVSEVPFLAFASWSFFHLVRYWNESRSGQGRVRDLWLSAGLALCMFLTHIHGFLFLPAYYALLLASLAWRGQDSAASELARYFAGVLLLWGVSTLYGGLVSFPYAYDIYAFVLEKLDASRRGWLAAGGVATVGFPLLLAAWPRAQEVGRLLVGRAGRTTPVAIWLLLVWGAWKTYQLAFLPGFVDSWAQAQWSPAGLGVTSLGHSSVVALAMYASPLLFAVYIAALPRLARSVPWQAVHLFTAVLLIYVVGFRFVIPFHYYFARYLLSELLPWVVLAACAGVAELLARGGPWRTLGITTYGLALLWCLPFTLAQSLGQEAGGADESLSRVARQVDASDLLVIRSEGFRAHQQIKPALEYVYDLDVLDVPGQPDLERFLTEHVIETYGDVFVLSASPWDLPYLRLQDETALRVSRMEQTFHIPILYHQERLPLYIYRVDKGWFVGRLTQRQLVPARMPHQLEGFYDDHVWTNGTARISGLHWPVPEGRSFLVLATYGYNPYKNDLVAVGLGVAANGAPLPLAGKQGDAYFFQLPQSLREIQNLEIVSRTFVPKEIGHNNDVRRLGVDVKFFSFR